MERPRTQNISLLCGLWHISAQTNQTQSLQGPLSSAHAVSATTGLKFPPGLSAPVAPCSSTLTWWCWVWGVRLWEGDTSLLGSLLPNLQSTEQMLANRTRPTLPAASQPQVLAKMTDFGIPRSPRCPILWQLLSWPLPS